MVPRSHGIQSWFEKCIALIAIVVRIGRTFVFTSTISGAKGMSTPLLTISNNHTPACGDPPIAGNTENLYVGYFENRYGEQWIFTYDRESKTANLLGGDINWNNRQQVVDGTVPDLVLQEDEAAWLRACWDAAVTKQTA
jgi:hypothetical protein